MARGLGSASSLVDSHHTLGPDSEKPQIDQFDVEMGSSSGTDYYDSGSCPLRRPLCDVHRLFLTFQRSAAHS
jgi:hypothetical protein